MGGARIFVCLSALVVAAAFIVTLSPKIYWSRVSQDGDLHKINLWENCYYNSTIAEETCYGYGRPDPYTDLKTKDIVKSLRDGAITGCVFTSLFSVIAIFTAACGRKCGTITLTMFGAIFATAAVGAWVEFMNRKGESWEINPKEVYKTAYTGLGIAAAGMTFAWINVFASCCISQGQRDKYGEIA